MIPDSVKNLPGWPTEPVYEPPAWLAHRSDSPAAWQRDAQEAARYAQPQQVIVNHYHAPKRSMSPGDVLGWVAVLGVVSGVLMALAFAAVALGLAAVAMAILAVVLKGLIRGGKGR
jgi:hypothetical protein